MVRAAGQGRPVATGRRPRQLCSELLTRWRPALHRLKTAHPEAASLAGGEGRALILDTEGTFRPERIMEISKRFDLNGEDVLNNIRVARVRRRATRTRPPGQQV